MENVVGAKQKILKKWQPISISFLALYHNVAATTTTTTDTKKRNIIHIIKNSVLVPI